MTEQELRALVREAIARQIAPSNVPFSHADRIASGPVVASRHASHAMFLVPAGAEIEGPCLIEPAVACNHCGYCKSLGH